MGQHNADELFEDKKKTAKLNGTDSTDNTFNPEELKTLQQKDLQTYLDKAGKVARLSFKKYKSGESEVQEQQQENENNYVAYGAMAEELIYYYHPDHLGTATYLTDINGEAYEFFLNLPFGETMAEQHSQTADYVNRWKFTGHELDRETGLYYAGARYYDPRTSIWLSVDPLAEKHPEKTPYHYCSNNPINRIDPDGKDDYEIDKQGNIINHIVNKKADSFHIVEQDNDGNWNRVEGKSISFKYGTIESKRSQNSAYTKRNDDGTTESAKTTIDIYKIRGDENGTKLFEFVSENTNVEWSQIKTGTEGAKGLNFLTTGHIEYTEPGASDLIMGQLYAGYTIRELNHNHPNNTPYPSGLDSRKSDIAC